MEKAGAEITLSWGASCLATDTDYAIYDRVLGDPTSHAPRYCGTAGVTVQTFAPLERDTYYLVVPLNAARESSYGTDSSGVERPQGQGACLRQALGACQ